MRTVRLNLILTENANVQLKNLSKASGVSKSELIRKALKLYALIKHEEKKGQHLALVNEQKVVSSRIVGL